MLTLYGANWYSSLRKVKQNNDEKRGKDHIQLFQNYMYSVSYTPSVFTVCIHANEGYRDVFSRKGFGFSLLRFRIKSCFEMLRHFSSPPHTPPFSHLFFQLLNILSVLLPNFDEWRLISNDFFFFIVAIWLHISDYILVNLLKQIDRLVAF